MGIEENTLIIFASDNGGAGTEKGHDLKFFNSGGPLRGAKGSLYEGGIRVPFIARWLGKIARGKTSDQAFAFWDMLPTFAEMAGVPSPEEIDGISITASLFGGTQKQHEYLYWESVENVPAQAVRIGDWKVIRAGDKVEAYNLRADIAEAHDVAMSHPEIVNRARKIFREAHTDSPDYVAP